MLLLFLFGLVGIDELGGLLVALELLSSGCPLVYMDMFALYISVPVVFSISMTRECHSPSYLKTVTFSVDFSKMTLLSLWRSAGLFLDCCVVASLV